MNLLPKSHEEFSQADYWNTFFKKRGKKSFEWYGEYPELCEILLKYVKIKDDILIAGCGNSSLSMSLYDVGYRNLTNIDISHIVIKQMKDINKMTRPDLTYEQMDVTEMSYPDGKFSVVLDKGTLDALMPDTKDATIETIDKYFKEVTRVLRNGGRYICISLLQEHILRKLLSYFPSSGFMFRISRCHEAEAKAQAEDGSFMPVFVIIATKFTKLVHPVLEIALVEGQPERLSSTDDMLSAILSTQQSVLVCNSLHKRSIADIGEISLDLYRPGDKHPRYTVHVLDQPRATGARTYAALIVPLGKEMDWLFSTKEGRQQVLKSAEKDRLAIITLRREHKFENLDAVMRELGDCVRNLAPAGLCFKTDIPFLSLASDVGVRNTVYEGTSEMSGSFVIEEVEKDGHELRRLVFLNNPYVIQSEARLKQGISTRKEYNGRQNKMLLNEIAQVTTKFDILSVKSRRGKAKKVVDPGFLACEHHMYMCIGVNSVIEHGQDEILIIGLGGGGLCTFLHHCFPKLKITAVDIDKEMLTVATCYFGLTLDDRMKVQISDGIKFIKDAVSKEQKYKAILFDVDSKDTTLGMSCPPKQFLDISVLKAVAECLTKSGLFILNLVSRDNILKQKAKDDLKSIFSSIACYGIHDEVNEILMCSVENVEAKDWKNRLKESGNELNKQACARKLFTEKDAFDVSSLMESLQIES